MENALLNNRDINNKELNHSGIGNNRNNDARLQLIVGDNDHQLMSKNNPGFHEGLVPHKREHEYIFLKAGTTGRIGHLNYPIN